MYYAPFIWVVDLYLLDQKNWLNKHHPLPSQCVLGAELKISGVYCAVKNL
jgi:hypothetical protein